MRTSYVQRAAAPDLAGELVSAWTVEIGDDGLALVPDGCLDLVWLDDGVLRICGPETRAWAVRRGPGMQSAGVRFRPGVAPAVLGVPAVELRDARVPMEDLWGAQARSIADQVGDAPDRAAALEAVVRKRLADAPPADPLMRQVARRLGGPRPAPVGALAGELGLSERQLHRRSTVAFGYGPSVLARVLRLQRFLALARAPGPARDLATLAAEAGYFDQPHLNRECRALAGATPVELLV